MKTSENLLRQSNICTVFPSVVTKIRPSHKNLIISKEQFNMFECICMLLILIPGLLKICGHSEPVISLYFQL